MGTEARPPTRNRKKGIKNFRLFHLGKQPNTSSLAFRSDSSGLRYSRNRYYTFESVGPEVRQTRTRLRSMPLAARLGVEP